MSIKDQNKSNLKSFLQTKKGQYSLISILVLGVLLVSGLFTYNLFKQNLDTASAASTAANGGNITIDKKYVVNGVEQDTVSISSGGSTTVRLRYTNSGTAAITDANIKDSLPAGFTYVPGTFKNCLNPSSTELVCDTLSSTNKDAAFNTLTNSSGVSPSAGLYDAASNAAAGGTAPTAITGVLDAGKKRYLGATYCSNPASPYNVSVALTGPANTPPATSCTNVLPTNVGNFWGTTAYDLLANRYMPSAWCSSYVGGLGFSLGSPRNTNSVGNCFNVGTNTYWTLSFDLLGKSYLPYYTCVQPSPNTNFTYVGNPTATNTVSSSCSAVYSGATGVFTYLNLQDTARSAGYMEYQVQSAANIAVGTYGTNVALSGTGFTTLSDGGTASGNGIVVTGTPAPSPAYNKLYSLDGTTWASSVSAAPNQPIYVRLLRANSGTLSAVEVNAKDSLPANFSYIAGTLRNCLSPSVSSVANLTPDLSELSCDSLSLANKDVVFNALTSSNGVSPIAGLYDAASAANAGGTSTTALTGTLDIGRAKSFFNHICAFNSQTTADSFTYSFGGVSTNGTNQNVSAPGECVSFSGYTNASGDQKEIRTILGNRFLNFDACGYGKTANTNDANNWFGSLALTPVSQGTTNTCPTLSGYTLNGAGNSKVNVDYLGKRYFNQNICAFGRTVGSPAFNDVVYNIAYGASTTLLTAAGTCLTLPGYNAPTATYSNFDTLDATRSVGFMEYQIKSSVAVTAGSYGTQSTLASTNVANTFSIPAGNIGTGITINGDPAFSVKKVLAKAVSGVCPTDSSTYANTLSGVNPNDQVCVRLLYQNLTDGAVANATIQDSINSADGLTYIANSTKNCLTPSVGSELCADASNMAGSGWTGNNGWTGTNFALAPHAGVYGQSATGATATMEMGKKTNIHISQCTPSSYQDYYIRQVDVTNSATQTVASCGGAGFVNTGISPNPKSATTIGTRYLHAALCDPTTPRQDYFVQTITGDNSSTGTATCPSGYSTSGVNPNPKNADTLGFRYLSFLSCTPNSYQDYFLQAITPSNSTTATATCPSGYTASGIGNNPFLADTLDANNGKGYIQYKLLAPATVTNPTVTLPNVLLRGDSQTDSTSGAFINFSTNITAFCTLNDPCALFDTALTYSPTQALAKRYGGSGSSTADDLTLTLNDSARLAVSGYTTVCTMKYKFKSDTTWRSLVANIAYNASTGCTATLLKADQLFWNVDFEISASTTNGTETKNFLMYANYDFKAGSIGVTSIGGSGL